LIPNYSNTGCLRARLDLFCLVYIQTAPLLWKTYKEHLIYFHLTAAKCTFCLYSLCNRPWGYQFLTYRWQAFYVFLKNFHMWNKPGFDLIVCGSIFRLYRHIRYFILM
jgi:hypothetical protein